MKQIIKRCLSGLLALVMTVSLVSVQAFAVDTDEPAETPFYLLVTHALELDGESYGSTEMIQMTEDDFDGEGNYDFQQNALERTGMQAVRGSYLDNEEFELVEGWVVNREDFAPAGDFDDGAGYYAMQLLIEYEVAPGYEAVVSDRDSEPGEYDAMALAQFKGPLTNVTFNGVDIITLTFRFEYSRTGGLAGTAAADTVVVEVPIAKDTDGSVIAPEIPAQDITAKDGFRLLLNPYPLNWFLMDPDLATELTREEYTEEVQKRIEEALANGYFSVNPSLVYVNGDNASGEYTNLYKAAWDLARISPASDTEISRIATHYKVAETTLKDYAEGSLKHDYYHATVTGDAGEYPGAASVGTNPKLKVEITAEQAKKILDLQKEAAKDPSKQQELDEATTITVYYRRNATSYTVNHWVPTPPDGTPGVPTNPPKKQFDGKDYVQVYTESVQGRVGALTNAKDSPAVVPADQTGNHFDFTPYVPIPFSQQEIALRTTENQNGTVIDIRYKDADAYRVIFNTDYTYIERQQVNIGRSLEFDNNPNNPSLKNDGKEVPDYKLPTRTGYTFGGWMYQLRDGVTADAGLNVYEEDGKRYLKVGDTLTLDQDTIAKAVIVQDEEGNDGIKALHLYPKWESGDANVRVVFWVEDLSDDASDDVKVSVKEKNASTYLDDHPAYQDSIKTEGRTYSNIGSVSLQAATGAELGLEVNNGNLTDSQNMKVTVSGENTSKSLTAAISEQFTSKMRKVQTTDPDSNIDAARFYSPANVREPAAIASDGSTVINVYYTRNIYSLDFTYYGHRDNKPCIATRTNGFSLMNNPDPEAKGRYGENDGTEKNKPNTQRPNDFNRLSPLDNVDEHSFDFPERITIQAKYGADLRDVWPVADGETVSSHYFISWATTTGPYNAAFVAGDNNESTLMGVYSAMGADIIANPSETGITHHLYAYWWTQEPSYYQYNHCYEIPQLDANKIAQMNGVITHSIYNNSQDRADVLYLVPCETVDAYGYSDLMKVKRNGDEITYEGEDGYPAGGTEYYAIRTFQDADDNNQLKCYAVARRVSTVSTNAIVAQNPSARLHLVKVRNEKKVDGRGSFTYAPDHSSRYRDANGIVENGTIDRVGEDKPYDLYFYYNRDRYTIRYFAPVTRADDQRTEVELGTNTVPYGTNLDTDTYLVSPKYTEKNTAYNDKWTSSAETPVCPDRSESGTAQWFFGGWYLDRACTEAMTWEQPISSNVDLYAKWTNNGYKVTFDWGDGTLSGITDEDEIASYKVQTIAANTRFTASGKIPRPVWAGHTLTGWYVADADGNATNTPFDFDQAVTQNINVVAKWTEQTRETYKYTVWYLCKVADDYKVADGEVVKKFNVSGENGKYLVLNSDKENGEAHTEAYPANTVLWLTAKQFAGFTPIDANKSVTLADTTTYQVYFLYCRNTTKKFSIEFVRAGTEDGNRTVISTEAKDDIDTPSTQITNAMFDGLKTQGYQLVKRETNGTYMPVGNYAEVGPLESDDEIKASRKATYLVQPIVYTVEYKSTAAEFATEDGETVSDKLVAAAQTAVAGITYQIPAGGSETESNVNAAKADETNPTRYTVEEDFEVKNPTYIQDPDTKVWWKFKRWTYKDKDGVSEVTPTQRANGDSGLKVDKNSVGNLTFYANWKHVTADLTVTNSVTPAVAGLALPDDTFHYTLELPADTALENVLVYKTTNGADASSGDKIELTSTTVNFTLKNGEVLSVAGVVGECTITQAVDGTSSFDPTNRNYYTLESIAVNGTNQQGHSVKTNVTDTAVSAVFNNRYHATAWLDTDGDPTDGTDRSFTVQKILLDEDGNPRKFFGGNHYYIQLRAGAQSPNGTPLPAGGAVEVDLLSTADATELNGSFGAIRFEQPGDYTYVINEKRPTGTDAVPGVTYDNAMYRVTVEVRIDGSDLTAAVTKLETRDAASPEEEDPIGTIDAADGRITGWTQQPLDGGDLTGKLMFRNTYNPAQVDRSFEAIKVLEGNRPTQMEAGEFAFNLKREGSHVMSEEEAKKYHDLPNDDARLEMLKHLQVLADPAQRLPSGVTESGKVHNGVTGAITLGTLDYTAENMGGSFYGKVYKYTLSEDIPEGAVDGWYQGMHYDAAQREIYVYVHLHKVDGTLATLEDTNVIIYADVLGDRNSRFVNTFKLDPIIVDIGEDPEDPDDPGANTATAALVKQISGRQFTNGDSFTFNITPQDGAPWPQKDGADCSQVVITPTSGDSASVPFGKIAFSMPGTYRYTLTEVKGTAGNMTYDTAEKTLEIRVHDDDNNQKLEAEITGVTWTNSYRRPSKPGGPGGTGTTIVPKTVDAEKPPVALNTEDHFAYIVGRSDGLAHPDDCITRAEVATIFYRLLTEESRKAYWSKSNPYPDSQESDWFNVAVSVISKAGIISGGTNGRFEPYNNITRAEFATVAARFLSEPYVGGDYYTDISGHWAREYINRAAAIGWMEGFDRPFRPDEPITRAEVMAIINAMIGRTPDADHMHEDMIVWPDNMDKSKWYYEDVQEATNSHEYVRIGNMTEEWTEMLPVRDWSAIEQAWSDIYDAQNPGDVVSGGLQ